MHPKFAIIENNTLAGLGLGNIIEDIIPVAEIVTMQSFEEYQLEETSAFVHCFVSSRIFFEHSTYFRNNHIRCIVMVNGDMSIRGVLTLNVCQNEKNLVRDILALNEMGHGKGMPGEKSMILQQTIPTKPLLTSREIEVAILLCKGLISKEIASRLNISLNTVITHRQNIIEKLHARSLADIIVYAVRNGILDMTEL